jgi:hypothetical protein
MALRKIRDSKFCLPLLEPTNAIRQNPSFSERLVRGMMVRGIKFFNLFFPFLGPFRSTGDIGLEVRAFLANHGYESNLERQLNKE